VSFKFCLSYWKNVNLPIGRRKRKNRNRKKKSGGKLPIAAGSENGVEEEDEDEAVEFEEILQNPASFQDEGLCVNYFYLEMFINCVDIKEHNSCLDT